MAHTVHVRPFLNDQISVLHSAQYVGCANVLSTKSCTASFAPRSVFTVAITAPASAATPSASSFTSPRASE